MTILRTDKDTLTPDDIVKYIEDYEKEQVPLLDLLWEYYLGNNTKILSRRVVDSKNPDNRTPISYGRKIITTFTGYAYRPKYITYKSDNERFLNELQTTFDENNEHIKTSLNGRNTGIFGLSYELMYIATSRDGTRPEIKFTVIDPREIILIYDYSIEPVKKMAIRFYKVSDKLYKVAVYYDKTIEYYDMAREGYKNSLIPTGSDPNYFMEVPIVPYYLGQEKQGIIEPVIPLIDDYDTLISDSMNEFTRFSSAYLKLVAMSITDKDQAELKRKRVFEQLKDKDSVSFLTKDIPTAYIQFMAQLIRDQIHIQSHVPDLGSGAFADGVSGAAVDRLMFDFENVVSSAEAEFDTGLLDRIRLISKIYATNSRADGSFDEISISHKRNKPANTIEYSQIALNMKNAGFSQYAIVDYMPDEMIPDTDAEIEREDEESSNAIPDVDTIPKPDNLPEKINPAEAVEEA